jgi:hypothetical protein
VFAPSAGLMSSLDAPFSSRGPSLVSSLPSPSRTRSDREACLKNGTSNGSTGWERQWHPPERARSGWAPRVRQVLSAYGRHERRRRTGRVAGRTGRIVPFGSRHGPDEHRDRGGIACAHSQGRRPHGCSAPSLDRNPVTGCKAGLLGRHCVARACCRRREA